MVCKYAQSVKETGLLFEEKTGGKIIRPFKIQATVSRTEDKPDGLRG